VKCLHPGSARQHSGSDRALQPRRVPCPETPAAQNDTEAQRCRAVGEHGFVVVVVVDIDIDIDICRCFASTQAGLGNCATLRVRKPADAHTDGGSCRSTWGRLFLRWVNAQPRAGCFEVRGATCRVTIVRSVSLS
jgi:hypothetical protein